MMTFLPSTTIILTYTLACIVLFVTPGPDMSLMLAKTLSGGRRQGFAALFGTTAGCCVQTMLAALGVSALLAASVTAFTILKVVGALYLLWLAFEAIRHGSALSVDAKRQGKPMPLWRTALVGLGINLTNPKVVLFFVTFLPQFVDASDPHASGKLWFLGLYFVVVATPLSIALVLAADKVVGALKRRPRVMRAIDYGFASLFGAFAIKMLTVQAR
ncbi:Threonine/homoserine/homoserine lactone efflux protein [Hyphomicrobiales bacterium]|nr:Threonine/homoserine/homoserine lactone efflux protein [Hyphomicrobiales bacterium]CAH1684322.1 Threonine/homoserine/homoserine lactone efflux protein [Hyphomicrobiales bacterium]